MESEISNAPVPMEKTTATNSNPSMMLRGWSPLTTRLLQEGGPSAWNVMDGVLSEDGCNCLIQELHDAKLFDKLLPARTKGDAAMDAFLEALSSSSSSFSSPTSLYTRGDKSLFLSREYRSRDDFSQRHPYLHRLISSVQTTMEHCLADTIKLDLSLTSVQLAVYPGDGVSGYARHCDRQGTCNYKNDDNPTQTTHKNQRIVTALYYLTDEDWHAQKDGGCLRLFTTSSSPNRDDDFTDICPYRDRLLVFRSDGVEHQVLPSKQRSRTAITMWFYGHERQEQQQPIPSPIKSKPLPEKDNTLPSLTNNAGPPPLPIRTDRDNYNSLPTIFVSIASFRDSETVPTMQSLFSNAIYPNRVTVGLVLQLDGSKDDAKIWRDVVSMSQKNNDDDADNNIRYLRLHARDALGPCYARALCQSLWRGETYVLQIDSHMRFRRGWDVYLIQLLQDTIRRHGTQKVLLTAYPVGYTLPNHIPNETRGTLLVPWKFVADDKSHQPQPPPPMLRQRGRLLSQEVATKACAIPCHLYAGGFNFGPSSALVDVPYDPTLHQLFFGEELSMAVRLFTHGYDLYAPPETVCYHLWSRAHRPTQSPPQPVSATQTQRQASLARVHEQLQGKCQSSSSNSPQHRYPYYGLGMVRSAREFRDILGVKSWEKGTFGRDGIDTGGLKPSEFADDSNNTLHPEHSIEAKIANLDPKAQALIAFLLSGKTA